MYKRQRKAVFLAAEALIFIIFVLVMTGLVPPVEAGRPAIVSFAVPAAVFLLLMAARDRAYKAFDKRLYLKIFETGETAYLAQFNNALRFCYSLDDFYKAIGQILETKGDCSILFIDRTNNYVLYNSPNRICTSKRVRDKLALNFPLSWDEGAFFFDDDLCLVTSYKEARGFFLSAAGRHLYVFCRYTKMFDTQIYGTLLGEFKRFQTRAKTISALSEISGLTKEWQQLADTQQSFLPQVMPDIPHLKLAAYFRPLVNVSGDYYSVLPIDSTKTLLMLGDVSGKGLPAALIMGLVMNTVKIIEDKENLVTVIQAVDRTIKSMKLQDKYTVLFLGIVDTHSMTVRYINASMSDPIVLSKSPMGYRIKPLTSNASLVGIIDMGDNIQVAEKKLFRGDVILMATDGVSEVMDDNGVELGDTELFKKTLQSGAAKKVEQFVDDIVNMIWQYNGNKKLHDDVTMVIAKVG